MPRAQLTDPWHARRRADPQPRRARAAGRHRQLVRAPAGQALRRRAGRLGDGLELRASTTATTKTLTRDAAHPSRGAPAGRSSMQLFGQDPEVMRSAARERGRGGRRPHRPQHGLPGAQGLQDRAPARRCSTTPTPPSRWRAPRARAAGLPVTVKLRSGRRPGETSGFDLAHRLVDEAGVAAIALPPALGRRAPQGRARLRPGRASWSRRCRAPVILTGGLRTRRRACATPTSTPAPRR